MKNKLLFIVLLLNQFQLYSQSADEELEQKYENYRDRQRKYFTQIGERAGQSIISAGIEPIGQASDTFRLVNGTLTITKPPRDYKGIAKFGDAVIDHGYYLAVLASEYKLMVLQSRQNIDAYRSLCNEIYFAINAIDRLDQNAEYYLNYNAQPSKNGFFIRSDHDEKYAGRINNMYWDQRLERIESGGARGPEILHIDSSNGLFHVFGPDSFKLDLTNKNITEMQTRWVGGSAQFGTTEDWGNEMSQDQLYGLLMGFMCVKQWVDDGLVVDPDGNDPFFDSKNIHTWVKELTARIITHVSKYRNAPIPINDISNEWEKLKNDPMFANIALKPYFGNDTLNLLIPDTHQIFRFDTVSQTYVWDTVLSYMRITIIDSANAFPGSKIKSANIWQMATEKIQPINVFKEGNYIITNPVRNNDIVTRGHLALPFGYAIQESAKYITGADTFPQPYAEFSSCAQGSRVFLDLQWAIGPFASGFVIWPYMTCTDKPLWQMSIYVSAAFVGSLYKPAIMSSLTILAYLQPEVLLAISGQENSEKAEQVILAMIQGCPLMVNSPDLMSLCLIGRPLQPKNEFFWRDLWNALPEKEVFKEMVKGNFTANLQHNLALASRTWGHDDFADWADDLGYEYSELFYCMLHGGTPKKSKSFYQSALLNAQCEGAFHAGTPDLDEAQPPYTYCAPFNRENIFAKPGTSGTGSRWGVLHNGVDYMLLFNLYKMADLEKWQTNSFTATDRSLTACPCVSYPDKPYTSLNRSVLETIANNQNDTFDGIAHIDKPMFVSVNVLNGEEYYSKPVYDYYSDFNIRIPNFLLHNLEIKGYIDFPDTAIGELNIEQDLTICRGLTEVKNYGKIEVQANANPNFPSLLTVSNQGILDVYDKGIVRINNNAKLLIEVNGKLKFHNGSHIILNGPNAVLHIKGKLELAPGAEFKIEGGPAGKGYIIWDNGDGSPHYGLATLEAGAGSSMLIEQANPNVLGLKVEGSTGMVTPFSLAKLKIQNCRVALGPASQLVSQADSTIVHNVQVKGYFGPHANAEFNFKATAKGLHQLGKRNSYKMVTISECAIGLTTFNLGTSEALNMQDVYFENCLTAIHNRGGRLRYKDGNIRAVSLGGAYMDLRNGIYGEGTQGASMLENVELSARHFPNPVYHPLGAMEQTHNLKVHGAGNYYFYKSKIQFADYGSKMDQAGLLPVCTEIFDNTTQLQHTTWSKFVAVNQAWNHIHWPTSPAPTNPKKMYFGYMSYLYLDKGQNQIMGYTGGMPYLQALLASDQNLIVSTDPLKWNTSAINATQNQWQTAPETQPAVNYNAIVEHGFPVANTIDINKLPLNTSNWQSTQENYCMNLKTPFSPVLGDGETESDTGIYGNGVGNGERRMPVSPADLGTMLSQHGQNGTAYVQSLRKVLRAMDMRPPNYGAIIDTFAQLLTQPLPDTVSAAVKHVYGLLQDFYLEVRTDKFIPEQDRVSQEQMVFAKMLALQQQLLVLSADTNSIWHTPRFELTRDKALLYRVFNQRTEAIAFLETKIPAWQPLYEKEALEVWKCILQWEQSYIDNQVSYNEFIQYSCAESWAAGANNGTGSKGSINKANGEGSGQEPKLRSQGIQEKTGITEIEDKNNFTLYPNPAENSFTVASNSGITRVRVYETNGRLLLDLTKAVQTTVEINIETLVRGTYIVAVETPIKTYRSTLVVNR